MLGWALCVGCLCVMLLLWSCKKRLTCECVQEPGQYRLVCKPSALATYLLRQCASFSAFCHVCWLWRLLPAMQTAVGLLGPRDARVHFTREYLQLADDGLVALDWALKPGHPQMRRRRTSSNSTAPLLLVIPNSFGRITRNTTKILSAHKMFWWNALKLDLEQDAQCVTWLSHQGYEAVIFNRRCQNECPLSTTKLQQYGDPNDLREAIRYIRHCRPSSRLFAAAEGTGAGLLLSYLGECGSSSYITAAGCISPLFRIQDWFEAGCPWLWQLALLLYQKMYLSRYATALGQLINVERLFGSRTLKELEEALFCQTKGSNCLTWDSYWERNDPLRDIDEVAIPVLCICSQDDPIRGEANSTIPFELFETNPHFFLLLTRYGGHCGFIKSISATIWSHSVLLDFFKSTVDFFAMEDRLKGLSRRKGTISGSMNRMQQDRASCRKEQGCPHNIHDIYNWQRSYTR